jgi:hypothetical protein
MALAAVEADLIIVPWFENEGPGAVEGLDAATGGEVARALVSKEFAARPFDLFVTLVVTPGWRARRVALVGAGGAASYGPDLVRKLATAGGLAARQRRADRAAFLLRPGNADLSGGFDRVELAQPIAEGLTVAEFDAAAYKTEDPPPPKAPVWLVSVPGASAGCWDSRAIWLASWPTNRPTR